MPRDVALELPSYDAPEDGVESLTFSFSVHGDCVNISACMNPSDDVMDADEGDFPQFCATISRDDFRKFREAVMDVSVN